MLHINHTEPSCQIPGHQHTYPQSHRHSHMFSWAQESSMVWGLQKYISLSKYSRPDQTSLSSVSKHPWDIISFLDCRAPNNSSSACTLHPQGSNLEAELSSPKGVHVFWLAEGERSPLYKLDFSPFKLGKYQLYATWKKMKLYFFEGSWPLFARQSHLTSESVPVLVKERAVKPPLVWAFDMGLWRWPALQWRDLDAETRKSPYWISTQSTSDVADMCKIHAQGLLIPVWCCYVLA